jgi:hypothetical protein
MKALPRSRDEDRVWRIYFSSKCPRDLILIEVMPTGSPDNQEQKYGDLMPENLIPISSDKVNTLANCSELETVLSEVAR